MVSIKVQLNKYRVKKDGTYPLVFQLIHNREKRLIYSSYHLFEKDFDENKMKVVTRRKKRLCDEVNDYIDKTVLQIKEIVDLLEKQGKEFSTKDIVSRYKLNQNNNFLITYFQHQIQLLKAEGRTGTAYSYQSTLNCLVRFTGERELFSFKEINERWVNNFVCYLRSSGLKPNSVNFYLRILRAVYNKACNEDVEGTTTLSPFRVIAMNNVRTHKKAVDKSIMQQIAQVQFGNDPRKEFACDLFLFSFYCRGMPFVDMAYLKYSNIINGYVCYSRHKTGQPLKIKITEPLQILINKYQSDGEYVLPILGNGNFSSSQLYLQYKSRLRQYNRELKAISESLNLPVTLSSYVSRHSWATLARENGIPVSVISEGMGHSSEKITYAYLAALDPCYIDDANEIILTDCFCLYPKKQRQRQKLNSLNTAIGFHGRED
jgi:integrase